MQEYSFFKNPFVPLAFVLGLAIILATGIGAWTTFAVKSLDNTVSVTGSAKTSVTSDAVRFSFSVARTVAESDLAVGYSRVSGDLAAVKAFLTAHGVTEAELAIEPASANQIYDYNNTGAPTRYRVSQMVRINSTRVPETTALAGDISSLSSSGLFIEANPVEYYYSKLADLRVSLLGEAVKDAKARADAIAKETGQGVGRLKSAASGVVQVLAPNSINIDDYGQYDTSSIEKEIMVTTRATFFVQ